MVNKKLFCLSAVCVVLLVGGVGCASQQITPMQAPPSQLFIQDKNEALEDFVVRIAIEKIAHSAPVFVALTKVIDQNDLYRGVSTEQKDIQRCWLYQNASISSCKAEELPASARAQKLPVMYFAFVSPNEKEKLIIIDYYKLERGDDKIDGFRLVIEYEDDNGVEKSLTQVY